jgi:hypothetical protein
MITQTMSENPINDLKNGNLKKQSNILFFIWFLRCWTVFPKILDLYYLSLHVLILLIRDLNNTLIITGHDEVVFRNETVTLGVIDNFVIELGIHLFRNPLKIKI